MTNVPSHLLPGFAPDNLLAVLALLGLLRALEEERPDWRPRAAWSGTPLHPMLHLAEPAETPAIAAAALDGLRTVAAAFAFDRKNIDFTAAEFRAFALAARDGDAARARIAAALASDGALKRDGVKVEPSVLCAIFGQGHQHFLERLSGLGVRLDADDAAETLARALFEPWRLADDVDTFRWDPGEDRRYAYRFGDPSTEKTLSEAGANWLAAIGFTEFASVPGSDSLETLGFRRDRNDRFVIWPIWSEPASLATIKMLLAHPDVAEGKLDALAPLGVRQVLQAKRISSGKYLSFERARIVERLADGRP